MPDRVGQAFLHDAEHGDGRVARQCLRLLGELDVGLQTGLGAGCIDVGTQRGGQSEVIQQRGAQVVDQAPFQIHRFIEHAPQLREALLQLGNLHPRLQPGKVHLGSSQQPAQLIVQGARDFRFLLLRQRLQISREARHRADALILERLFAGLRVRSRGVL